MANAWLRLWHDMPNDPKWRTISRASKQPISAVMAVYIHVLVCASNADERGRTQGLNNEDIASALDLEVDQVDAILSAMQGRVLDGDSVSGWEKRQPKREDGAAERAKAWRDAKKNASERTPNAEERPDKDTDTDKEKDKYIKPTPAAADVLPVPDFVPLELWNDFLEIRKSVKAKNSQRAVKLLITELTKLRDAGNDPVQVLNASIRNTWKDVYPLKGDANKKQQTNLPRNAI